MTTHPSVHVRLPAALIDRLHQLADEQGVSLNALLLALIAGSVGFTSRTATMTEPPRLCTASWPGAVFSSEGAALIVEVLDGPPELSNEAESVGEFDLLPPSGEPVMEESGGGVGETALLLKRSDAVRGRARQLSRRVLAGARSRPPGRSPAPSRAGRGRVLGER
jgi:hypothetical protein